MRVLAVVGRKPVAACSAARVVRNQRAFSNVALCSRRLVRAVCSSSRVKFAQCNSVGIQRLAFVSSRVGNNGVPVRHMSSLPDHLALNMPALSPTMEEGNLASWQKKVGDRVEAGDVMAEVETDKATVAWEAVEEGYIAKILVQEGASGVKVGTLCAILVEEEEDIAAFKDFTGEGGAPEAEAPAVEAPPAVATPAPAAPTPVAPAAAAPAVTPSPVAAAPGARVVASPRARMTAAERGIDISQVQGTGPNRRVISADVLEYVPAVSAPTAAVDVAAPAMDASGNFVDIPNNMMRKVVAKRLLESKTTIPHYYLTTDINMDSVLSVRAELNGDKEKADKLSVNDFIIKASSLACMKVPAVNSTWTDEAVRQFNYVDCCVAVKTPTGLITPIVKDADIKGLSDISASVKDLAARAREGKLAPEEFQGGTFTISNMGMFGVKQFCAIINPPQAAILAVGTSETRVIPSATKNEDGSPAFTTASFMSVTLSLDHRVVDGAVGAQWLQEFKKYMESPITMLL